MCACAHVAHKQTNICIFDKSNFRCVWDKKLYTHMEEGIYARQMQPPWVCLYIPVRNTSSQCVQVYKNHTERDAFALWNICLKTAASYFELRVCVRCLWLAIWASSRRAMEFEYTRFEYFSKTKREHTQLQGDPFFCWSTNKSIEFRTFFPTIYVYRYRRPSQVPADATHTPFQRVNTIWKLYSAFTRTLYRYIWEENVVVWKSATNLWPKIDSFGAANCNVFTLIHIHP